MNNIVKNNTFAKVKNSDEKSTTYINYFCEYLHLRK